VNTFCVPLEVLAKVTTPVPPIDPSFVVMSLPTRSVPVRVPRLWMTSGPSSALVRRR
jgi:hypothetical protein